MSAAIYLALLPPPGQSIWPHLHSPLPAQAQCLWSVAQGTVPPPPMWRSHGDNIFSVILHTGAI